MKSKVKLSNYASMVTLVLFGAMVALGYFTYDTPLMIPVYCLMCIICLLGLCFAAGSVSADKDKITVTASLMWCTIQMKNVKSCELFQPTMASRTVFGSFGFMGYWGIFKEPDVGRYTAYYGKASDCFMVRLKDGKQLVLGCANPAEMVAYINSQIK